MLTLRVLVLKEAGLATDISDDLKEWSAYEREAGITLEITEERIVVDPLVHESFHIVPTGEDESRELFGLKGMKDVVRKHPSVREGRFDAVFFVYDLEDTAFFKSDPAGATKQVANWTFFSPLFPGMPFSEIVSRRSWPAKDPFRVFSHEIRHNLVYRLRALGYPIPDVMDMTYVPSVGRSVPYYREYEPYAKDGNRAVQNLVLKPYMAVLAARPEVASFIERLKRQLANLMNQLEAMNTNTDSPGLVKWAEAIKKHEGWFVGSRSHRNLNPGNFRLTGYTKSLGALAKGDEKNFAIFPTYEKGWEALLQFLRDARANQLIGYRAYAEDRDKKLRIAGKPEGPKDRRGRSICTLEDFFNVYAPVNDDNDSARYAKVVAEHIGCTIATPIDQI